MSVRVTSVKVPLVGAGLAVVGVIWFFVSLFLGANAYLTVFPSTGLFFTGGAIIGVWLALKLFGITGFD